MTTATFPQLSNVVGLLIPASSSVSGNGTTTTMMTDELTNNHDGIPSQLLQVRMFISDDHSRTFRMIIILEHDYGVTDFADRKVFV